MSRWVKRSQMGIVLEHTLSGKRQAACVMDEAIKDGVGQSWITDGLVPVLNRTLAGDDRRTPSVSVF